MRVPVGEVPGIRRVHHVWPGRCPAGQRGCPSARAGKEFPHWSQMWSSASWRAPPLRPLPRLQRDRQIYAARPNEVNTPSAVLIISSRANPWQSCNRQESWLGSDPGMAWRKWHAGGRVGGLPRTRRRSVHDSRNLSRAPTASLRDRLRRPLTEPVCRMVRQLSGSGEGPGQDRVLSPHRGDRGDEEQDQRLTATVTATAATTGYQQRPATAHNTRMIRANWGYVRPEKRKVVC